MTEYDFSPAAVERYKEKQRGISRWVQETQKHNPPNPISSRPQAYRSSTYNGNTPTRRPSSNNQSARPSMHRSHTDASRRPNMRQPTRSYTTPAAVARPMAPPPPLQLYSAPPVYGPVIVSPVSYSYGYNSAPKKGVMTRIKEFVGVDTSHPSRSNSKRSDRNKRNYSY